MNTSIYDQLHNQFSHLSWQQQVPLAPFTYMKIGGPAEVLWEAKSLTEFVDVLLFCQTAHLPVTILGGASNVLIADEGLPGLVIINKCEQITFLSDEAALPQEAASVVQSAVLPSDGALVMAESGTKTASLVGAVALREQTGLEPFLGVPGSIGGAVYNNAHYTEELIGNFVVAVEVLNSQGQRQWLSQAECEFGYDASRFHRDEEVILRAIFVVRPGNKAAIQETLRETTVKRATTQPLGTSNSGCMFQNVKLPPEVREKFGGKEYLSAGWLIDQTGLKLTRVGKAVVSHVHANFLVNEGGATSQEVEQLISLVQEKVKEKFGLELEREVFFLREPQFTNRE